MQESQFVTFQRFETLEHAEELISDLKENGIQVRVQDDPPLADAIFIGSMTMDRISVKINQIDFPKADQILEKIALKEIEHFPDDHYLYEFKDNELFDILKTPDEWSREDVLLSQKILKDRGHNISKEKVEAFKQERNLELSQPETGDSSWILAAYLMAFLGGLMGAGIGMQYKTAKKTLPSGERVYTYDAETREKGRKIFLIGVISFAIWVLAFLILWGSTWSLFL